MNKDKLLLKGMTLLKKNLNGEMKGISNNGTLSHVTNEIKVTISKESW